MVLPDETVVVTLSKEDYRALLRVLHTACCAAYSERERFGYPSSHSIARYTDEIRRLVLLFAPVNYGETIENSRNDLPAREG